MAHDYPALAQRYLTALEQSDAAVLDQLLHPDMRFTEHPNRLLPSGLVRDRAAMSQAFAKGQTTVKEQRYQINDVIAAGSKLALRVTWSATLNVALGKSTPGEQVRAEFGMFLRFQDGQIVEQHNYDCFYDF